MIDLRKLLILLFFPFLCLLVFFGCNNEEESNPESVLINSCIGEEEGAAGVGRCLIKTIESGYWSYIFTYDLEGKKVNRNGQELFSYNESGRITSYGGVPFYYNENGKLEARGNTVPEFIYDNNGNVIKWGDITYSYDARGFLDKTDLLFPSFFKEGVIWECWGIKTGDDYVGTFDFYYDQDGRLTQIYDSNSCSYGRYLFLSFSYSYDAEGNFIEKMVFKIKEETIRVFDKEGKLLKITNSSTLFDPTSKWEWIYFYDSKGRLIKMEHYRDGIINRATTFSYIYIEDSIVPDWLLPDHQLFHAPLHMLYIRDRSDFPERWRREKDLNILKY